jgi:hypothetical protein
MITNHVSEILLNRKFSSLHKHQRFLNHTFALAMDYRRSKHFPYAPTFKKLTKQFHIQNWQQWIYATYLHPMYGNTCLAQKKHMLCALEAITSGEMKLTKSSDVGLSIHISDYQLEQGELDDTSCAHVLALLEMTCVMHAKDISLVDFLFGGFKTDQSAYLKAYLKNQSLEPRSIFSFSILHDVLMSELTELELLLKCLVHTKFSYRNWDQSVNTMYERNADRWGYVPKDEERVLYEDHTNDLHADHLFESLDRFANNLYQIIRIHGLKFSDQDNDDTHDLIVDLNPFSDESLTYPWAYDLENDNWRASKKPKLAINQQGVYKSSTSDILGVYLHSKHIRLYAFKIEQSAQRIQLEVQIDQKDRIYGNSIFTTKHILLEVYLHELSHYFAHQARLKNRKHWHWMADSIKAISEGIAQWFSYSVAQFLSKFENIECLKNSKDRDLYRNLLSFHQYISPKKTKAYYFHMLWIKQYQPAAILKGICDYISKDHKLAKNHLVSHLGVALHLYHFQAERLNGGKLSKAYHSSLNGKVSDQLAMVYCPHTFNYGLMYTDLPSFVDQHYWISESLITRKLWANVMGNHLLQVGASGGNLPMALSALTPIDSIKQIMQFCNRLSKLHGYSPYYLIDDQSIDPLATGYRMPSKDQWIHAKDSNCRSEYQFESDRLKLGWFAENSHHTLMAVKQKHPNLWGIYDVYGLLREIYVSCTVLQYFDIYHVDPEIASYDPRQIFLQGGAYDSSVKDSFKEAQHLLDFQVGAQHSNPMFGFRVVRPIDIAQRMSTHLLNF